MEMFTGEYTPKKKLKIYNTNLNILVRALKSSEFNQLDLGKILTLIQSKDLTAYLEAAIDSILNVKDNNKKPHNIEQLTETQKQEVTSEQQEITSEQQEVTSEQQELTKQILQNIAKNIKTIITEAELQERQASQSRAFLLTFLICLTIVAIPFCLLIYKAILNLLENKQTFQSIKIPANATQLAKINVTSDDETQNLINVNSLGLVYKVEQALDNDDVENLLGKPSEVKQLFFGKDKSRSNESENKLVLKNYLRTVLSSPNQCGNKIGERTLVGTKLQIEKFKNY